MSENVNQPLPKQKPRRLARRALGWLLLLIVIGCGLGLYFRLDLINRLAPGLIAERLAVPTEFALSMFDWREARIERIRLGKDGALLLEGIDLGYDPWNRRLERVEIDRVALAARYDTGFSLGELDPLVNELRTLISAGDNPQGSGASDPPAITIRAIEIDLASPAGLLRGRGQATLDNRAVIADFILSEAQGHAEAAIDLALSLAPDGAAPSGDLRLKLEAESALWGYLGLDQPASGQIDLGAEIRAGRDWQKLGRVEASWHATVVDFAYPGFTVPLAGELRVESVIDRNRATFTNLAVETTGGIQAEWTNKIGGAFALDFAPLALGGRLKLESGGKALALAPLGGGDVTLQRPQLGMVADIAGGRRSDGAFDLDLSLAEPASLSLQRAEVGKALRVTPAARIEFRPGEAPLLQVTQEDSGRIAATVTPVLGKGSITLEPAAAAERLIIAMPQTPFQLTYDSALSAPLAMKVALTGAQIAAPLSGVTMSEVALDATYGEGGLGAKFSSGAVAGLGAFVPVTAEANVKLAGDDARFDARFRGADQPIDLSLKGHANIATLSGKVDLTLAPIAFTSGGLQPYNLFPPLRSWFDEVSGRIEAKGPVSFEGGKLTSDLKLGVENFSGKVGPVQLLNVNSVVEIDRPWPLSTKPDQQVAIQRADIGLPLTDALFRFKISDGKRLDLAESRLAMSGGEVRLDPVTLLLDAPVHNMKLTVTQVSVNELFAALGVAGLSGEGSISGAVPVSIFPGGIAIPAAELKADAPGVLRYDRAQAPAALQSAGESVAMALEALSDFHYKELILTLTRQLTGDVNLGLHISGANPNFYDGYPVEFNLSVEGRLDEALREGLAGYQVPDMIQEQLETLAP